MSEQKNVKYKYSGDADKLGYIAQLTADNARLRKAIEEADFHDFQCNSTFDPLFVQDKGGRTFPCDCGFSEWKRNALEGGGNEKAG